MAFKHLRNSLMEEPAFSLCLMLEGTGPKGDHFLFASDGLENSPQAGPGENCFGGLGAIENSKLTEESQ